MSAQDAPTVAPAAIEPASVTTTASTASRDPVRTQTTSDLSPETRPELGTDTTDGTTAAASAAPAARGITDVTKAEKIGNGEVLIEAHPVNDGILSYKGPGLK